MEGSAEEVGAEDVGVRLRQILRVRAGLETGCRLRGRIAKALLGGEERAGKVEMRGRGGGKVGLGGGGGGGGETREERVEGAHSTAGIWVREGR